MGGYRIANSFYYVDLTSLRNPSWILELEDKSDNELLSLFVLSAISDGARFLSKKETYRILAMSENEKKSVTKQTIEKFTKMDLIYAHKNKVYFRPKLVRSIYNSLENKINYKKIKFEIRKKKIRNTFTMQTFCISLCLFCYPEDAYRAFIELCPFWKLPPIEQKNFSEFIKELFA